jgi:hypothetical protein
MLWNFASWQASTSGALGQAQWPGIGEVHRASVNALKDTKYFRAKAGSDEKATAGAISFN